MLSSVSWLENSQQLFRCCASCCLHSFHQRPRLLLRTAKLCHPHIVNSCSLVSFLASGFYLHHTCHMSNTAFDNVDHSLLLKIKSLEQVFVAAIKTLPKALSPHMGVPAFKSQLYSQFQLPAGAYPRRQQVLVQVLGTLLPKWETQFTGLQFTLVYRSWLEPGLALAVAGIWGINQRMRKLFLFLSLSLPTFK